MKARGTIILLILFLSLQGCATTYHNLDTIRVTYPHRIKSKTFQAPILKILDITKKVCQDLSLQINNIDKQGKAIKIYALGKEISQGLARRRTEIIAIYLNEIQPNQTNVEIAAERRNTWNFNSEDDYRQALKGSILNLIEIELFRE